MTVTVPAAELARLNIEYATATENIKKRLVLCMGTGCMAGGAEKVKIALLNALKKRAIDVQFELNYENGYDNKGVYISGSGCQGFCQMGPLLTLLPEGTLYVKVKPEDAEEIVDGIEDGTIIERLLYKDTENRSCITQNDNPFYAKQHREVLKQCGRLNPLDLREAVASGAYEAIRKAVLSKTPDEVCNDILSSGLRGRGGGGFPTGKKWQFALQSGGAKKYVICNGDEGDPGAFMDRSVMEGNPHGVIEGMMIAGYAIGANEGVIYVRAEYPLAVDRLRHAVAEAQKEGLLGYPLFGSAFSFTIEVMEGAGAFVCGEETALIASVEGGRGMPRPKPPFPAKSGLFGRPTVINNVETLASVPQIIRYGGEQFRKTGTANSPGTKTFALTGHVRNTGLIEVPFGTTLRTIVFDIGGGVTGGEFKAVQIGGPSGGCLTREHLDMPLDFDSLTKIGAMVGSGGLVVMNDKTCMVKMAHFFMQFTQNESCGKCVPCREGTRQMLALLEDIMEGRAEAVETEHLLRSLAATIRKSSLCGLGKTAPNPVLAVLALFADEIKEHIESKLCKTGECRALTPFAIIPEKCKGCGACIKVCPVGAINGVKRGIHTIDSLKCIRCGACITACKFNAVAGRI